MEQEINNALQPELSKQDRRILKQKQKAKDTARRVKTKKIKKILFYALWIGIPLILIGAFSWFIITSPELPEEELVSTSGIHWHPNLEIYIHGERQVIPANIGLNAVGVHRSNSIHTHVPNDSIHLEFSGRVLRDSIKLKQFFSVWGEEFSSECILGFCNGEDGQVKLLVNDEENFEFAEYVMKDGDNIEIRYEE
jgi:hypothetical protein